MFYNLRVIAGKALILALICLFAINDISWCFPDGGVPSGRTTLAASSRFTPFFKEHGLDFKNTCSVYYALSALREIAFDKNARESHIAMAGRFLPEGEIELVKDTGKDDFIEPFPIELSKGECKYAVLNFIKENKRVKAIFVQDPKDLNEEELLALGIKDKTDRDHFFDSGIEGVWLLDSARRYESQVSRTARDILSPEEDALLARLPEYTSAVYSPKTLLLGPGQCSLRCRYCLQRNVLGNHILSHKALFRKMLLEADKAGITDYGWCIGEPFERPDFLYEMLGLMCRLKNVESIGFVTNAAFAKTPKAARKILRNLMLVVGANLDEDKAIDLHLDCSWDKERIRRGVTSANIINLLEAVGAEWGEGNVKLQAVPLVNDNSLIELYKALKDSGLVEGDAEIEALTNKGTVRLTNGVTLSIYVLGGVVPEGGAKDLVAGVDYTADNVTKEAIATLEGRDKIGYSFSREVDGNFSLANQELVLGPDGKLYLNDKLAIRSSMPLADMTDIAGAIKTVNHHPVLRALVEKGLKYCLDAYAALPPNRKSIPDIIQFLVGKPNETALLASIFLEDPQLRMELLNAILLNSPITKTLVSGTDANFAWWEHAVRATQELYRVRGDTTKINLLDRIVENAENAFASLEESDSDSLGRLHGFFAVLINIIHDELDGSPEYKKEYGRAMAMVGLFYSAFGLSAIERGHPEQGISNLVISLTYLSEAAHNGYEECGQVMGITMQRLRDMDDLSGRTMLGGRPVLGIDSYPVARYVKALRGMEQGKKRPWSVSAYYIDENGAMISQTRRAEPPISPEEAMIGRSGTHAEVHGLVTTESRIAVDWHKVSAVVTLEPCLHCAKALAIRGIGNVSFGIIDPNPDIRGEGLKELYWAGIPVTLPSEAFQASTMNLVTGDVQGYSQDELKRIMTSVVPAGTLSLEELAEKARQHLYNWPRAYTYADQWEFDRIVSEIVWHLDGGKGKFEVPQIITINADQYSPEKAKTPELDPVQQVGRAKGGRVRSKPFRIVISGTPENRARVANLLSSVHKGDDRLVGPGEIYFLEGIASGKDPRLMPMTVPGDPDGVSRSTYDKIHQENLKHIPTVPKTTVLCHIIPDSIVPADQWELLSDLEQELAKKDKGYTDRIVRLKFDGTKDFSSQVKAAMDRYTEKYSDQDKGCVYEFDIACPGTEFVDSLLKSGLGKTFKNRALAFAPCKEPAQVEGIILALRVLRSGSIKDLIALSKILPVDHPELIEGMTSVEDFIKRITFIMPLIKCVDHEEVRKVNDIIREKIKNAA